MGCSYSVISVIGDGSLTGGMAYEALNNAAQLKTNFIIILNDNEMSISENVGGLSAYLSSLQNGGRLYRAEGRSGEYTEQNTGVRRPYGGADPDDQKRDQADDYSGDVF